MSLLELAVFEKRQVDENETKLDAGNSGRYKLVTIYNSKIYVKESASYLLMFYYLVFWKCYLKEKNT